VYREKNSNFRNILSRITGIEGNNPGEPGRLQAG
jgi:hypothetical protein